MQVSGVNSNYFATNQTANQTKKPDSFSETLKGAIASPNLPLNINIPMLTEDTLRGGGFNIGNGTFVSYTIKWAENSTEDNPIMTADGYDENGKYFCETINIKKINPNNATWLEMLALEAHLSPMSNDRFNALGASLPFPHTLQANRGLNDRFDFFSAFDKTIWQIAEGGSHQRAKEYQLSKQAYYNFFLSVGIREEWK